MSPNFTEPISAIPETLGFLFQKHYLGINHSDGTILHVYFYPSGAFHRKALSILYRFAT